MINGEAAHAISLHMQLCDWDSRYMHVYKL